MQIGGSFAIKYGFFSLVFMVWWFSDRIEFMFADSKTVKNRNKNYHSIIIIVVVVVVEHWNVVGGHFRFFMIVSIGFRMSLVYEYANAKIGHTHTLFVLVGLFRISEAIYCE